MAPMISLATGAPRRSPGGEIKQISEAPVRDHETSLPGFGSRWATAGRQAANRRGCDDQDRCRQETGVDAGIALNGALNN